MSDIIHSDIVIIGAGQAGWSVVDAIRAISDVPVLMISRDSADRYAKPMLSSAVSQNKTRAGLVRKTATDAASEANIRLVNHTLVLNIDKDNKRIITDKGDITYYKLVLAIGATPVYPNNVPKDLVFNANHLDDFEKLLKTLTQKSHIAIIGGGMVGVELAEDLIKGGHTVSLIDKNPYPLYRLLPKQAGQMFLEALVKLGVNYVVGTIDGLTKTDSYQININGEHIDADAVIVASGLVVDKTLPESLGLDFDKHTGIDVDKFLQTSAQDVYAMGDCVAIDGVPCRFIAPHRTQAEAIAHAATQTPHNGYTHATPTVRLKNKVLGISFVGVFDKNAPFDIIQSDNLWVFEQDAGKIEIKLP